MIDVITERRKRERANAEKQTPKTIQQDRSDTMSILFKPTKSKGTRVAVKVKRPSWQQFLQY